MEITIMGFQMEGFQNRAIILEDLKYILFLLKLFGIFPHLKSNGRIFKLRRLEALIVANGSIVLAGATYYFWCCVRNIKHFVIYSSLLDIDAFSEISEMSLCVGIISFEFSMCTVNRNEQCAILNTLMKIDENLLELQIPLGCVTRKVTVVVLIFPVMFFSAYVCLCVAHVIDVFSLEGIVTAYYLFMLLYNSLLTVLLCALLTVVRNRIKIVNEILHYLNNGSDVKQETLVHLLILTEQLLELLRRFNAIYGPIVFTNFMFGGYTNTDILFYWITIPGDQYGPKEFLYFLHSLIWVLAFVVSMISLACCGETLHNELMVSQMEGYQHRSIILEDLKFILFLLKLFGIFPQLQSNGRIFKLRRFQALTVANGSVVLAVVAYYVWCCVRNVRHFVIYSSVFDTDAFSQISEISLCIGIISFEFFMCTLNRNEQCSMLNSLMKIDESLVELQIPLSCVTRKLTVIILILPVIFFSTYVYLCMIQFIDVSSVEGIVLAYYLFMLLYNTLITVLLCGLLTVTRIRIKILNETLHCLNNGSDEKASVQPLILTEQLLELLRRFNAIYGPIAFFTFIYGSYTSACILFFYITAHENQYDPTGLVYFLHSLTWALAFVISMICLACCGESLHHEAKRTAEILARAYGKGKDYQNIIDKFLTKSIRQETKFTAYGFFTIDNSTLFKIISAVTTYLVILIQFKQLEESKTS